MVRAFAFFLVLLQLACVHGYVVLSDSTIKSAVDSYISGGTEKEKVVAIYGDISEWDTSMVTDMRSLFYKKLTFNEDISLWDVSSLRTWIICFTITKLSIKI